MRVTYKGEVSLEMMVGGGFSTQLPVSKKYFELLSFISIQRFLTYHLYVVISDAQGKI